jgi:flagellar biosynthesis protein FlhF
MCGFSSGWVSSAGAALPAAAGAPLLEHQVGWLNQALNGQAVVHAFDGGTPALWRQLSASGALWLAQPAGSTRVYTDETPTLVSAVAKRLAHQPVTDYSLMPQLRTLAGVALNDLVVWFGHTQVHLRGRNQPHFPLRLVSVRLLNRQNGQLLKQWAGISNISEATASAAQLAVWLAVRNEHRQHMRWLPRAWNAMPVENTVAGLSQKALLAAQTWLATWQLQMDTQAQQARLVGAGLTGRPGLPAAATVPALLKLFKLKTMTA